jgi:hypothetical protein
MVRGNLTKSPTRHYTGVYTSYVRLDEHPFSIFDLDVSLSRVTGWSGNRDLGGRRWRARREIGDAEDGDFLIVKERATRVRVQARRVDVQLNRQVFDEMREHAERELVGGTVCCAPEHSQRLPRVPTRARLTRRTRRRGPDRLGAATKKRMAAS